MQEFGLAVRELRGEQRQGCPKSRSRTRDPIMPLPTRPAGHLVISPNAEARAGAPLHPSQRPPSSVSWKGVLVGILLLWPNAYWQVQMEIIRGSAHPTTVSLFYNC